MRKQSTGDAIRNFMEITGTSQVFLYGGAAIDRYINPEAEIMDYDVAIQNPDKYVAVVEKLKKLGFDVGATRVAFNLSTVAKHSEYGIFDLACMNIEKNGIYNLEKFYIEYSKEYPLGKAVDRYGTVHALREGKISLVNNPDEENAYDLLRRFSVLAGKYGFSLEPDGINKDTIETLHRRLAETPVDQNNEHGRVRCLARFMGAVLRSERQNKTGITGEVDKANKKQSEFLEGMGKTELLSYAYPEINNILHNRQFLDGVAERPFTDKFDLIDRLLNAAQDRDEIINEISLLRKREADREDVRVINRVNSLMEEKTSKKRLVNHVINPVFSYIMAKSGKVEK